MMRFKDLGDYRPDENNAGRYRYEGAYYIPQVSGKALRLHKWKLMLLSLAPLLSIYLMGRLNTAGFRQLYVLLPFLALMFFSGRAAIGAFSMLLWKERMTQREYQQSFSMMQSGFRAAPFASGAMLIAILLFFFFGGKSSEEWPQFPLAAALAGLDFAALRLCEKLGVVRREQASGREGSDAL